jgi:hypothetical protein
MQSNICLLSRQSICRYKQFLMILCSFFASKVFPLTSHFFQDITYHYIKKVIYCGIQNIVVLPIYYFTLISIQRRNKVVGHLMQGLLTLVKLSLED